MATISLDYTISAADQTRVLAAFQQEANDDLNGVANASQVLAFIKKAIKQEIIDKVRDFERRTAVDAIVPPVDPVLT